MKSFALITLAMSLSLAQAGERYENYVGIRALGMGGAAVATVNDETALLVNPAGLGKLRDYIITIFDPEIEAGSNTAKVAGSKITGMTNPQTALDQLKTKPDQHLHQRLQVFPSIVVPNFGIGVLGKTVVDARVDSATNTFLYDYTNDYTLVFGFNLRLWNGIIKLGVNSRVTNRMEIRRDDIDAGTTGMSLNSLAAEGMGVGSDAGLIITAPVAWLPTLVATYRDMGRTSYNWRGGMFTNNTIRPDSTPGTVDVALALHPILGNRSHMTWTVQYNDVLTYGDETDHLRRFHGGIEFNYADALFLRAGMNQSYWTAGMELAIINYQFQFASYGEDIGAVGTPKEDRRYVVKFAFRF